MKRLAATTMAIFLGLSGAAFAQVSGPSGEIAPGTANGQRNGDAPGTNNIPGAPPSTVAPGGSRGDVTGTVPGRGPGMATTPGRGVEGTPGNGTPSKRDGNQE